MSWSVTYVGTAERVKQALIDQAAKMQGESKIEYEAALPHLVGLVEQNYVTEAGAARGAGKYLLEISARGHGSTMIGAKEGDPRIDLSRNCLVEIRLHAGALV